MTSVHIVVAGAGGNIGSHLLPHLARMAQVSRLTLVDPDCYEPVNLAVQNVDRSDLGQAKVVAQAARLGRIREDLAVEAIVARIEDVPRGLLACDLFLSCLDSKLARQHLNELAWRMSTPWIDAGILGSQNLVRVSGYWPSQDGPCLECSWAQGEGGEYALLEEEYLCGATRGAGYPSLASSLLGSLAASLLAFEAAQFFHGEMQTRIAGKQLILDAEHRVVQVTAERRNPWCRFDHRRWKIDPWPCNLARTTVHEALDALGILQVEGHHFAIEVVCPGCARKQTLLRLNRPLARCARCNRRMATAGFGALERLDIASAGEFLGLTLAAAGLRVRDVVSHGDQHRQLVEEP